MEYPRFFSGEIGKLSRFFQLLKELFYSRKHVYSIFAKLEKHKL